MKITTEPLPDRQLILTIEVDEERTQQAMRRAARQIAKQVSIPGFRKGKAPYGVIVQRYGEDTVRKEAADMLANDVYREALEQEKIEPYTPGVLEELLLDPITFKLAIPLKPTVDMGDYRDYRLELPEVTVEEKDVQRALEEIRQQHAILEPVERPAALGDVVAIDLVGQTAEGAEFLREEDFRILLDTETADPFPGFSEAVVGMEVNEERTFILTLPADFPREELRDQEAEFTVTLREVYERILPHLDDDLARTAGNLDSLKKLQEYVKEQLWQTAQEKADEKYVEQVLEDVIEQAQIAYPPVMLEEELDEMVKDLERAVKRDARLSLEDYLRIQGKSVEEVREELEPRAAAHLKRALVLGEVVKLEKLAVDEGEVSAHIEAVSAPWGIRADEVRASLDSDEGRQAVHSRLLVNRAMQRLVAIAKGEAPEAASDEASDKEQGSGEAEEQGNEETGERSEEQESTEAREEE